MTEIGIFLVPSAEEPALAVSQAPAADAAPST